MFEIDKNAFGAFLAEQRKARGYTQKDLAARLFVSDKAVSKWERALSMPDISLLIPLANILEVSVMELLEGRRLDTAAGMDTEQVERLVKTALTLSEETPEKKKERRKRNAALFGGCTLLAALEILLIFWCFPEVRESAVLPALLSLEGMSLGFGAYFWIFIREKLPLYYDENPISTYSDGPLRLHLPGIHFNNSNWPHMVSCLRGWSLASLMALPLLPLLLSLVPASVDERVTRTAVIFLYLGGLFLPLYRTARKHS